MSNRLSQAALEVLVLSNVPVTFRVSQAALEVLTLSNTPVSFRLSQAALEVLHSPLAEVAPSSAETASTFVFWPV